MFADCMSEWITDDVSDLAKMARNFFEEEMVPRQRQWAAQHRVDRDFWTKAGELGLLCAGVPEQYGGGGGTLAHDLVVLGEQARLGEYGFGNIVHSGVVAGYLMQYGSAAQKDRWLPAMAAGESVAAIALTEPSGGSDLKTMAARAVADDEGYRLSGTKSFVTNGGSADLVLVAAKTDPTKGTRGISLFVIETADCPGFARGPVVEKIGQDAGDVVELSFDDSPLGHGNRIGAENTGLAMMLDQLPRERLLIAAMAAASLNRAVELTVDYAKTRPAQGGVLYDLQNTRTLLAECATQSHVGEVFLHDCVNLYMSGRLDPAKASMAKYWLTEVQCTVIDQCLQVFGAYGYTREYPIGRMYIDSRAQRIYGGANEVMKEVIAGAL